MRDKLLLLVDGQPFNNVIIGIIVLNSLVIGLQTSETIVASFGPILDTLDTIFLTIFVVELVMRMFSYGTGFVKRPWSVFDFIVVGIALTPGAEAFSVVRALRILRALRLISQVPTMRVVVEALLRSLPGLGSTAILLLLIFYVGGVMTTVLFKASFPEFFGDLGASIYSLFQIMTLESWSMGIVRPVMEAHPYAWLFFVPFVIVTSILVLNLVVAIVVDSMQSAKEMMAEEGRAEREAAGEPAEATLESLQDELRALRSEVQALRAERGEG
ncbi:MAG: ion transporter [Rhodospirillales bacterium]|nr:ion transporter [Rhodospirillales bacterium]MBO6786387.1 ion transporter [Rhodospirillales bacterium]